ncbi:MAG: DNA translocase FtsK 4TM domain-containing protein [Planctomycetes bacterium]|nr:DNA translocase FtsK 4TM domain-containing protein [Planctomycetota bacterium]
MAKAARQTLPGSSFSILRRELAGFGLFTLAAFLMIALASFSDPGLDGIYAPTANLCGETGRGLARVALHWFGFGAYLGIFMLFAWSLALIGRRTLPIGPFRLLWFGGFVFSASALLSSLGSSLSARLPDRGGLVGHQVAAFFETTLSFGPWGSKLVLLVLLLASFQLSTDFMLYGAIAACGEFLARRRQNAAAMVKGAGPLFSALLGKDVKASGAAAAEIGVTDAEVEGFAQGAAPAAPAEDKQRQDARRARKEKRAAPDASGAEAKPASAGPSMLDADPESEVVPEPAPAAPALRKVQAKINFEPPAGGPPRAASFDRENTAYAPPPRAEHVEYVFPSLELLDHPQPVSSREFQKMVETGIQVLETCLASYKVEAEVEEIQKGPVITMFELNVAPGTRVDRIRSLEDDLAIRLKAPSVRIVAPIPGKSTIGIEVPNPIRETVRLRELISSPEYRSADFALPVFLGKDAAGRVLIEDLAKMPHLLVAGATGTGKSVCLNTLITSILYTRTPDQVKLILIDPKMVELSSFESIPHLMCPVVRDMNRAAQILEWATVKMDERYNILAEAGARNIFSYNKLSDEVKRERLNVDPKDETFEPRMPFIVIVVDELADLMMVSAKEVENYITRLAQKSRAVGIHIVLATQRPSTNVITGLIKANMPTRLSFQVASKIDSRVVLDQNGAEKLLGSGDMLYIPPRTSTLVRAQGAFVSDEEIKAVVDSVKTQAPLYHRELIQKSVRSEVDPRSADELYDEAVRFVLETRRGSASLLQRRFSIGYTRASRLIDLMAEDGILGEFRNAQARDVLITLDEYEARQAAEA